MIDVYRTDEEQIEAIKKWWKKDGLTTIAAVVVAAAAYFGWQYYQEQQMAQAQARSLQYQELLELDREMATVDTGENRAELDALIADLSAGSDGYSLYASMIAAKYAVQDGDLAQGATLLGNVLDAKPDEAIADLARLRLARVLFAQADYDAALSTLVLEDTAAWDAESFELQGDIFVAQAQFDQAVVAYEKAQTVGQATFASRYVTMKLNNAKAAAAVSAPVEAVEDAVVVEDSAMADDTVVTEAVADVADE